MCDSARAHLPHTSMRTSGQPAITRAHPPGMTSSAATPQLPSPPRSLICKLHEAPIFSLTFAARPL